MKYFAGSLSLALLLLSSGLAKADALNVLGSSESFAVLGASTVTNTGATVLMGNLGVAPGSAITGFPPGVVVLGVNHGNDATSVQAHTDALSGYNTLAALSFTQDLTGQDLGGQTLSPGVYFFSTSAQLTGALTLDFQGLDGQSFVFQTGSTLTTASGSSVNVIHAGLNDSVYWQIGSSATLGTASLFQGSILADQSITLTTGATVLCGNALALNGAVTLDTNIIASCGTDEEVAPGPTAVTPEPGTFGLMATGVLGAAGAIRRRWML
ncbi:MAG: hypothetical protein NVSMB3_04260 [Acidobacteriaceae bacterium]